MAAFYEYFNEQKYADAVKNVSAQLLSSNTRSVSATTNCLIPVCGDIKESE